MQPRGAVGSVTPNSTSCGGNSMQNPTRACSTWAAVPVGFTRRFAAAGLNTTGVDLDADALAFACAQSAYVISYVEGDARCLPFPDRSFDHVTSIAALCFVDDWPRAIAEIVLVTRHRFVLGLLNRTSLLWFDQGSRRW